MFKEPKGEPDVEKEQETAEEPEWLGERIGAAKVIMISSGKKIPTERVIEAIRKTIEDLGNLPPEYINSVSREALRDTLRVRGVTSRHGLCDKVVDFILGTGV